MKHKILMALLGVFTALQTTTFAQTQPKWEIQWTDHTANPVNLNSPGPRAYKPFVLYNADWPTAARYRVWYDIGTNSGIACATSPDGTNWSAGTTLTGLNTASNSFDGADFAGSAVVLYNQEWAKPYRLYYSSKTGSFGQDIWVAESTNGIAFENNQVALASSASRMDQFPDGHAVLYLPGRNVTPADPETAQPFIMYYSWSGGGTVAYAVSKDGYTFTDTGSISLSDTAGNPIILSVHPTQILKLAQNDLRMLAFDQETSFKYLVSAEGFNWTLVEDPVTAVGITGGAGTWNDQQNFYASAAYLGEGRFYLLRGGSNADNGLYRSGAAFGYSPFYATNDLGKWAFYSPFNDYVAEGWTSFTSAAGNPIDGTTVAIIQNPDGTVSVRDRRVTGNLNFYLVHDAAWSVPFTYEFRARIDDATTTVTSGKDLYPKYTLTALQTDLLHTGNESWQPAFSPIRSGNWNLTENIPGNSTVQLDNMQFQTFTVVCRFDEPTRALFSTSPSSVSTYNTNLCVYELYTNRNFSAPAVTFRSVGFVGWPGVDSDGRLDIGWPGPSSGQVTVDWVRWGNGVILDPLDPGASSALTIQRIAPNVKLNWTGGDNHSFTNTYNGNYWVSWTSGGTLQSSDNITGPWTDQTSVTNGSTLPATSLRKFYRVRR
jgi:hypothetical protein